MASDPELERAALDLYDRFVDVPEAERAAWLDRETEGRPNLRARVEALHAASRSEQLVTGGAGDWLEEAPPPQRLGAYRIGDLIGRGGMGSVYRGERVTGDFAHAAAIKIVKPGLISDGLAERFRRERQTLATLSHTNIAQLFDGGETDDGSPYFVMELVDGLPLGLWLEEHKPSRAQRVDLFRQICAAVGFAHSHLIVHRDITPSNVLVAKDGHVKLIDFGIARPVAKDAEAPEPGSSATLQGLSLTPGYAAPERRLGGEVTTAADIFSLGRVLEHLMPDERSAELRAIIARATATEPTGRYPTVDALSADVLAWRDDMPVAAVGASGLYATRKFIGRHRISVAATAIGLALLIGALVMTLLANVRAEEARAEAERRYEQTRAIARTLLFDVYDEVSRVPGSTRAREQLARTGLTYIEALAADATAPQDVRVEAGRGYLRLAEVVGGGLSSQLGRYQDANALLARSDEILTPLVTDGGADPAPRRALAALRIEQSGVNLYNNNEVDRSRAQAHEAQTLVQNERTADLESARLFADAVRAEGDTFLWSEDYTRAKALFLSAEAFIAGLPPAMQRDPQMQSIRAANLRYLGEALHNLRETEPARGALDQAVALNQTVLATQPDDPLFRRRVVTTLRYRAIVHRTNHRNELARESIEQARQESIRLRDRDANDAGSLQLFAVTSEVYMQTLSDLGRNEDAFRIADEIRTAYRAMVERAGNAPGQLRSYAMALRSEGEIRYNGRDYAGACRTWAEIVDILTGLERRGALTEFDRNRGLAETRRYIGQACAPPRAGLGGRID